MTTFETIIGRKLRVLMTGGSAPGFPSLAEYLLKNMHVFLVGTDYKSELASRSLSNDFFITPSVTVNSSSAEMKRYVEELNKICILKNIEYIFPIRTGDVMAIAEFKDDLSAIPLIPTTSVDKLKILNDKLLLMGLAKELNLNPPIYSRFTNVEEFDEKANKIISQLKTISDKVVIKPRIQSGSRGMRIMSLNMDNDEKWDQFLNKKPSENIYMTKKQLVATSGWTRTFDMIMMEYLPGTEYTVDCLCYKGVLRSCSVRERLATEGGISSKARVVPDVEKDNIVISNICAEIIKFLDLSYNVGFQFKCDAEGNPKLIECNPRLQGTTCLSIMNGTSILENTLLLAEAKRLYPVRYGVADYIERTYKEWYGKYSESKVKNDYATKYGQRDEA